MIKICVFSDSHGNAQPMIDVIEKEKPALCFFLGDGERDIDKVQERFPDLPVYAVRGNCDLHSRLSSTIVCTTGGVCIFATHGHLYNVKYEPGYESLISAAKEAGATLALFGHTHEACIKRYRDITLVNPGAVGFTDQPGCAVLTLKEGHFAVKPVKL